MNTPKTSNCRAFAPLHYVAFVVCVVILVAAGVVPFKTSSALSDAPRFQNAPALNPSSGNRQASEWPATDSQQAYARSEAKTVEWRVQPGDTLTHIFRANKAPVSDLQEILAADAEFLSLETLTPGTRLELTFDNEDRFNRLALYLDPARKVAYARQKDGTFVHQTFEADTYWVAEVLRGSINGSFYASALRAGLTQTHILLIDQLLGSQLDFRRDLRAGDRFTVILGHEMTGKQSTGNTRIEAISLKRSSRTHYAFRFDDGNYYDQTGESVMPAFLRWPTEKQFRVSSAFNHNRLHPITGRRTPHNGVDLATPVGTPIISTGNGIVRRIGNHPYAGKYIDIDHGDTYTTRYLHLEKILVRSGAQVRREQRIALSGNSGRSTGPHLHFEFHIKGRPVDPLTAKIPTAAAIPKADARRFDEKIRDQLVVMKHAGSPSELVTAEAPSLFN